MRFSDTIYPWHFTTRYNLLLQKLHFKSNYFVISYILSPCEVSYLLQERMYLTIKIIIMGA